MKNFITTTIFTLIFSISFSQNIADYLIPKPVILEQKPGNLNFEKGRIYCESISENSEIYDICNQIQTLLKEHNINTELTAQLATSETPFITINTDKKNITTNQGYEIDISTNKIDILVKSANGLFYALQTLKQIFTFKQKHGFVPNLHISDFPEIPKRGLMIDVSRDKVPTIETLFKIIDNLSSFKINEIQLYTEHTFAYQNHKKVWENYSPYTADDILKIDRYCNKRYIDLVPNQNTFGHMWKWLRHSEYTHLSECETPTKTIWGKRSKNCLSPAAEGSLPLVKELLDELSPNFSSKFINVGCDETIELGLGKSKEICNQKGKGRVYLDYLKEVFKICRENNKVPQFWGDIIIKYPKLIPEIPKDVVCMIWGYEHNHPYSTQCPKFKQAGIDFYVCPGTSTWRSPIGRTKNSFLNLENAANAARNNGAIGYLITDWGDLGHWQPFTISYSPILYGAALSWNSANNKGIDIKQHLNTYIYKDTTNITGEVVYNLGKATELMSTRFDNTYYFNSLRYYNKRMTIRSLKYITIEKCQKTIEFINNEIQKLDNSKLMCEDADLVKRELINTAKLCIHGCKLAIAKLKTRSKSLNKVPESTKLELKTELSEIIKEYKKLWLLRNRSGGLHSSAKRLTNILNAY